MRNRSCAGGRVDAEVELELADRLQVGQLQEERPPVLQDVGRADRQRIVARHGPGAAATARASHTGAVAVVPRLGEVALGSPATSRSTGRLNVTSTPFSCTWEATGSCTGLARVADALEAAVGRRVGAPAAIPET